MRHKWDNVTIKGCSKGEIYECKLIAHGTTINQGKRVNCYDTVSDGTFTEDYLDAQYKAGKIKIIKGSINLIWI